jgi:hypothetical protein
VRRFNVGNNKETAIAVNAEIKPGVSLILTNIGKIEIQSIESKC